VLNLGECVGGNLHRDYARVLVHSTGGFGIIGSVALVKTARNIVGTYLVIYNRSINSRSREFVRPKFWYFNR